jgi:alpha-N-acetylglucosamine transferase
MTDKTCVITFCNSAYLNQVKYTISALRSIGKYNGDIVLMVSDDLKNLTLDDDRVIVKYFPLFDWTNVLQKLNGISTSDGRDLYRRIQWQKINTFDPYFKNWDKCLFIDGGMIISKPVDKILNLDCTGKFLAHSDSYPEYRNKLNCQFESNRFKELYEELNSIYDLNIDYFQTTMYLFDTKIIQENTIKRLLELGNKFINTRTNEQAIMNLLMNCELNIWEQIQIKDSETYYYDFIERSGKKFNDYIMIKHPTTI